MTAGVQVHGAGLRGPRELGRGRHSEPRLNQSKEEVTGSRPPLPRPAQLSRHEAERSV